MPAWSALAETTLVWDGIAEEGEGAVSPPPPTPTAPLVTSASSFTVAENVAFSSQLTADQTVTWAIIGGDDQAQFSLSAAGLLEMVAQDYETPSDADTDRVYEVQVRALNATTMLTVTADLSVTVTDVSEGTPVGDLDFSRDGNPNLELLL